MFDLIYHSTTVLKIDMEEIKKTHPEEGIIEQDEEGKPILDEEFNITIEEFKEWCLGQEKKLQDLFIKEK